MQVIISDLGAQHDRLAGVDGIPLKEAVCPICARTGPHESVKSDEQIFPTEFFLQTLVAAVPCTMPIPNIYGDALALI